MTVWRCIQANLHVSMPSIHPSISAAALDTRNRPPPGGRRDGGQKKAHLHSLQILQPFLHKLLHPPWILDTLILAEGVPCAALGIFAEVVRRELVALAEELAVLQFENC